MSEQPINQRKPGWVRRGVGLVIALLFFLWAGSAADPRGALPWAWTAAGGLTFSRGLAFVWIAGAALFAVLSRMTYRLMSALPQSGRRKPWAKAAVVLLLAVLARGVIGYCWRPLPLNPAMLALAHLPAASSFRWLAIALDMAIVCLLLAALVRARRSLWWAALYALHPLALWEIAGNGSWIVGAVLPLVLVATIAPRLPRWTRATALIASALAAIFIVAATATRLPFNSLAASLLAFIPQENPRWILPLIQLLLQTIVLLLAWARGWPFARALGHIVVILLLGLTVVYPSFVLLSIALLPLAWNRAAWVLSLTVLVAYAAVPALAATHHWAVPQILVTLAWAPVMVVELQELAAEAIAALHRPGIKSTPAPTPAPP